MSIDITTNHVMAKPPPVYDVTTLRLERAFMATLRMLAAKHRRPLSTQIKIVLEEGLKAMKVPPPPRRDGGA